MEYIGLSALALQWFKSYLSQRYQAVCVNSAWSDKLPVASGVLQGSVLGELLLSVDVDDLSNVCQIAQPSAKW